MAEYKQFVLERYPTAYSQENDGFWDINIDSQQGLVDGADDKLETEEEAWERAAKEIAVGEATLDDTWRYLNDREDEDGDTEDWDKGAGSKAKAAVVNASKLLEDIVRAYDTGKLHYPHLGPLIEKARALSK